MLDFLLVLCRNMAYLPIYLPYRPDVGIQYLNSLDFDPSRPVKVKSNVAIRLHIYTIIYFYSVAHCLTQPFCVI